MNRLRHFITQSIDWYDGSDELIFFSSLLSLEKTAFVFDVLAFCLLQRDKAYTSGETTS